jgi:endonuclease III
VLKPDFRLIVTKLRKEYGVPPKPPADPWEIIAKTAATYLVDDERATETYESLVRKVGSTPEAVLDANPAVVKAALTGGGMLLDNRVRKLTQSARLARDLFQGDLRQLAKTPALDAKRKLRKFPGIGEPGADWILLVGRSQRSFALESNGLRVVQRLGLSEEKKSYSASYRAAVTALDTIGASATFDFLIEAHQLLRVHGKKTCTRTSPGCERCPIQKHCLYFTSVVSRRTLTDQRLPR